MIDESRIVDRSLHEGLEQAGQGGNGHGWVITIFGKLFVIADFDSANEYDFPLGLIVRKSPLLYSYVSRLVL